MFKHTVVYELCRSPFNRLILSQLNPNLLKFTRARYLVINFSKGNTNLHQGPGENRSIIKRKIIQLGAKTCPPLTLP